MHNGAEFTTTLLLLALGVMAFIASPKLSCKGGHRDIIEANKVVPTIMDPQKLQDHFRWSQ